MEILKDLVCEQHLTVTPHLVSKSLNIHVSEASKVMQEFVDKFSNLNLQVKYLHIEENDDSDLLKFKRFSLVDEDDPKKLSSDCPVYSVAALPDPDKSGEDLRRRQAPVGTLNFDKFIVEPTPSNLAKLQRLTYISNPHVKLRPTRRPNVARDNQYDKLNGEHAEKTLIEPVKKPRASPRKLGGEKAEKTVIEPVKKPRASPRKLTNEDLWDDPFALPKESNWREKTASPNKLVKREISEEKPARKSFKRIRIEDDDDEDEDNIANNKESKENIAKKNDSQEFKVTKLSYDEDKKVKQEVVEDQPMTREVVKEKPKPKAKTNGSGMKSIASYFTKKQN